MQKKWALLLLSFVGIVTVWLGSTLPHTFFDYNFDKFYKPDEPTTTYFEAHKKRFGTDNDFILIGLVSKSGIFNSAFLEKVAKLTTDLEGLPHVKQVTSPTSITNPVREPLTGAIFNRKLIAGNFEKDSIRIFADPSLVSNFFSKDTSAVSILIRTDALLSKNKSDELSTALNTVMDRYTFDGVHLAGRSLGQVVYINKIQFEFALFMGISIIFVILLLYLVFRSFRGVLIPLITVLLAVVWSIGILNLSGRGISILLNMLPPVIFVVGMSDAVHLLARYLEELRNGASKNEAIREMIFDTGLATLLTSITTAIGFASLYFTGIPALQEFGLLTAAGVLSAYVIAISLMPAWLSLSSPPEKSLAHSRSSLWDKTLRTAYEPVVRLKKWIFVITGGIAVVLVALTANIDQDNYLLEDLRPEEKLRQDFTFFDQYFSGVRPFELGLKLKQPDDKMLTRENLEHLAQLEDYLMNTYGAAALTSPVTFVKEINRSFHAGRSEYYALPENDTDWTQILNAANRLAKAGKMQMVMDSTRQFARISGRVGDLGAKELTSRNLELEKYIGVENLDQNFSIEITGTGTLIDRTNQEISRSLAKGLGVAFLLIALIMGFMFRSIRMVGIALIPNILPLLAVSAVMAVTGIDLKMSTSIIFTIAFGIAVDDTIHLLSRYKLELAKGKSAYHAMKNAYIHTGKALVITSIILFGGFFALCFSSFQSTFYIGMFVTLTLVFALIFDLTLLPGLVLSGTKSDTDHIDLFADKAHHTDEQTNANGETEIPGQG